MRKRNLLKWLKKVGPEKAAKKLGVSVSTVKKYEKQGKVPKAKTAVADKAIKNSQAASKAARVRKEKKRVEYVRAARKEAQKNLKINLRIELAAIKKDLDDERAAHAQEIAKIKTKEAKLKADLEWEKEIQESLIEVGDSLAKEAEFKQQIIDRAWAAAERGIGELDIEALAMAEEFDMDAKEIYSILYGS